VAWRRGPLNYFDLAARGDDGAVWFKSFVPGSGWSAWYSIGGSVTSAPSLNSQGDGIVNVFARGADGSLVQKSWNGSTWGDWASLGGGLTGAPATISRAAGLLNVYIRGTDQESYARSWSASGWSPWGQLDPTPVSSTPAPISDDPNHEAVFARDGSDLLLKSWTAGQSWGPWVDLGPIALPSPAAPAPPAPTPDGEVGLETGLRCTPSGGKLRVHITIRRAKGKAKPRVQKIVFYTQGKGRRVRVDRKSPFVVHMTLNRPAGSTGRVYARVYYKRSKHGPTHRKTVSRRYVMCR
jgi:hypothetical protein